MDNQKSPVLDLRQLHYFLALAEHGSISSAAAVLGMAQPSLSENISKLEKKLEVQLAIRGVRGVQLTEAGEALAKLGREVVRSADALVEDIRQLGGEARGPVSIGLPPSLSLLLSVPLVETIQNEHPQIRLHVAEAMSGHITEWIGNHQLDLGCVYEVPESAQFAVQPILTEELFLVTAPDNWRGEIGPDGRSIKPISAAALQELPMVLTSLTHGARKLAERFARGIGIQLNVITEIDSLTHIIEMVSRASAYTLLTHAAVVNQVAAGTLALVPIEEPTIRRTAYLVRKRSRPISRASVAVEAALMTVIKEMVERYKLEASIPSEA